MEVIPAIDSFREWVPIRFYRGDQGYFVDWCYMGAERLTRPFFEDSVNARFCHPFSLLFRHQTEIEFLGKMFDESRGIPPTGFIFHTSRCGSTLVSQLLASVGKNIVISEAGPIDSILRTKTRGSVESVDTRIKWLRWMVSAFGQSRAAGEEYLFIKFDSWSAAELGLIRQAFPEVPWIFLYRNPLEVIASHMARRGVQMVPGLIPDILPGVSIDDILKMPHEEYCARVLDRICRSALQHCDDERGLFINYSELPGAVTTKIAKHFGVSFSPEDLERMRRIAGLDAKSPHLEFEPDTEKKNRTASDEARAAARRIEPIYLQLEGLQRTSA